MPATTPTIYDIRQQRNSIEQQLAHMQQLATQAPTPELLAELSYALQHIAFTLHSQLRAITPAYPAKPTKATAV
ncbi:MAG TPA: hypothetical protein PKD90_06950 [Phnomibacter sp.]|nr:hypothetical protein [Phnomibacter sp.]